MTRLVKKGRGNKAFEGRWPGFFPEGKYPIVMADPPWPYYGSKTKMAAAGKHYDLMSMDDICSMPMRSIMAKNSVLFLWATGPRLHFAMQAIEAWGLHFRGVPFIWVKTRQDGQIMGARGVRATLVKPISEFVLAATTRKTGRPLPLLTEKVRQVVLAPVGEHSVKPPEVRQHIETLLGDLPRIELFAREYIQGWDVWMDGGMDDDTD